MTTETAIKRSLYVVGLIVILLLLNKCSGGLGSMFGGGGSSTSDTLYIHHRDTILSLDTTYIPIPKVEYETKWKKDYIHDTTIINNLDSISADSLIKLMGYDTVIAMLNSYHKKLFYSDTIIKIESDGKDTSYVAVINDTIYKNGIIHRQFFLQNLRESKIITVTKDPQNIFLIGGFVGGGANIFDIGISGEFMDKSGRAYGYSYSITTKSHRLGVGIPIFRK